LEITPHVYSLNSSEDIRIQLVDAKIENHRQLAKRADHLWSSQDMESVSLAENAIQRRPSSQKQSNPKLQDLPKSLIACAIITAPLVKQLDSADNHVRGRETTRPVASWP
jgi:hypothetical protein